MGERMWTKKKICIFGSGGFAKEVLLLAKDVGHEVEYFVDLHEGSLMGYPVVTEETFNPTYAVAVAVGSPRLRKKIVENLKLRKVEFATLIHPTAKVMGLDWSFANV